MLTHQGAMPGVRFSFFARAFSRQRTHAGLALLIMLLALPLQVFGAGKIVISQVYGGGGNTNAAYKNDYIELFNAGDASVSLNGLSVQYAGSTGNFSSSSNVLALPNATLNPGQYYLIQGAAGAGGTTNLPTPDVSFGTNLSGTTGKVALVSSSALLNGVACPAAQANVVDFVGFGNTSGSTANCSEPVGPATSSTNNVPTLSNTTAAVRNGHGCDDTDLNSADFTVTTVASGSGSAAVVSFPARNTATAAAPCSAPTNPVASGAATPNIAAPGDVVALSIKITPGANPASTFTSPSAVVAADISAIVPGATNQAFSYSSTDGSGNLNYTFSTTIDPGTAAGSKSLPITATDDQGRSAAVAAIAVNVRIATPATIMDIQGHGARSSYAGTGTTLGTTYIRTPTTGRQNIVTAVGPAGFFMQDAQGDNDLTTSDGIYVYTGSGSAPAVTVGDSVVVVGRIQEFSGSTEIAGGPSYTVVSSGNPLPAAYDLSLNLPNTDSSSGICTGAGSNIVVPSADGQSRNDGYQAANFACLDGMLVTMSNGTVNAPTYTTANSGITPSPTTPNSGFFAVAGDARSFRKAGILANDANRTANIPTFWGAPELVQVYYPGLGVTPASLPQATNMPAGGIYSGGQKIRLTGIIQGYQSATMPDPTYELYPRTGADLQLVGDPTYPVAVPDPTAGKLRVGTQNMLHFFNASFDGVDTSVYTDRCLAQPADVAGNLSGLNTPLAGGADDTCPTPAQYQTRLSKMSLQIRTILKAPTVQVVQEAENLTVMRDLAAKIQSDDSSIVYQPYLLKGNDPGGINIGIFVRAGVTVNSVTQLYLNTTTSACSSGTSCLLNDRPPVLLDAEYQGYHFRVLAIYDRSLGSLGAAGKDYVGQKRRAQAEQVACIVQALQTTGMAVDCDPAAPGSAAGNAQQDAAGNVTSNAFPITGDATTPVIVLGDFNAYEFSDGYVDVTGTIMGTVDATASHSVYPPTNSYVRPTPVMFDTGSTVAQAQHYSYNFGGYLQEIDHILLTDVGKGDFVSVDSGRGNSDTSVASLTLTQPGTAVRTSDHDGQVVTLGWVVTPNSTGSGSIAPSTVQTVSTTKAVVFTVTPAAGNQATVTDNCGNAGAAAGSFSSATNTYTIPPGVKSDCQVSATFGTIPSYTVTTTLSGTGGSISAPAQSPVQQGQSTTFTVTALTGYSIASVTGDTCTPSLQSGSTYTTGAITANCTITASFTANPVNGTCGTDNGQTLTVTPTNLCSAGTASAVTGSGPWSWTCSGSNGGSNASCSANIQTWTVTTVLSGTGGTVSAPASATVNHGSATTFTVSANPGYSVGSVVGDTCTPVLQSGSTWSTGPVTANCTITASFNHQAGYTALNPSRILDTRAIGVTSDGQFAAIGALNGGQSVDLTVLGRGGIPASAVKAVVLNVTATGASAATYVTAWPTGSTRPLASNLNVFPGQNSPNLVIVQVGTGGKVSLFNALGSTDLIADVQGYFTDTSDLTPLVPGRLLDTRSIGVTVDGTFQKLGPVAGLSKLDLTVAGRYGIPASGVGSVILNVAATGPASSGYVVVWPAGTRVPATSNLNFVAGQTIPNLVITQVGSNGKVSLFSSADTDLIADVMGWFPTSSDLTTLTPARLLDTRGIGVTTDGQFAGGGAIAGGSRLDLVVTGRGNVPASGVNAVVLNVTATGPTASGFLTAWPTGSTKPFASNLNFVAGQTVPNLVIVKVGDIGKVSLFNSAGNTDVVVDVVGWFAASSQ